MWDNNAPLQLLKTMPSKLNQDHLEKIQLLIDADKYKNSIISGFDLCGIFAPFCRGCDRTSIYPCAVSYIRMLQSEGMNIEIDASPSFYFMPQPYKPTIDIPQTKPRANINNVNANNPVYEQRPVRKPVDRKYGERKPRVPKEVKNEIAVTEAEPSVQSVQQIYTDETVLEHIVERKEETKSESFVKEQVSVEVAPEVVATKKAEPTATKKIEKVNGFGEKPLEEKRFRIAVARRKLNF